MPHGPCVNSLFVSILYPSAGGMTLVDFWHFLTIMLLLRPQNGLDLTPIWALLLFIPTKLRTLLISYFKVIYELNQEWYYSKFCSVENRTISHTYILPVYKKKRETHLFVCAKVAFSICNKPFKSLGPPSGRM